MSRGLFSSASKSLFVRLLATFLAVLALAQLKSFSSSFGAGQKQPERLSAEARAVAPNVAFDAAVLVGSMSQAREGQTATLLQNGKVLVAGGRSDASTFLSTAEVFDPVSNTWKNTDNAMSVPRYGHVAVMLRSGQVMVFGGRKGNGAGDYLDTAELYDSATNRWTTLTARMTAARFRHTGTLLQDGRLLVTGGENSTGVLGGTEFFNPSTQTWTSAGATGNLNDARRQHTATLLGSGRVLVAGGGNASSSLKSAETFDTSTNKWKRVGSLQTARQAHTATLLPDGNVLVAAGANGSAVTDTSELYAPFQENWSPTSGNLGAPRRAHTAVLLPSSLVLVAGGLDASGNAVNSAQVYNRFTKAWSAAPGFSFGESRGGHTATLLHTGRVLFAGGQSSNSGFLSSSEYYDPATAFWLATTSPRVSTASLLPSPAPGATPAPTPPISQMTLGRKGHTATTLPDGRVLVAGGRTTGAGGSSSATNTAEIYSPLQGRWTAVAASMNAARAGHTATLLPNGKVLIVGGDGGGGTAELFDPVSNTWALTPSPGTSRTDHTATLLPSGKVLIVGGQGASSSAQLYDYTVGLTGGWASAGTINPARTKHSATLALVNGNYRVFIFGGLDASNRALKSARYYNPESNSFSIINADPTRFRYGHTATLLPDGRIFFSGGRGGVNVSDVGKVIGNSEIFNPDASAWDVNLISTASRIEHTATLLPNGKVLLIGGRTISASGANCAEPSSAPAAQLFDPQAAAVFTSLQDAPTPLMTRSLHTATLLITGQLLLAGGEQTQQLPDCNDAALRHSELYDFGLGFNESWRPVLSYISGSAGGPLTIYGSSFQGISEATGHGGQNSASNYPLVQLRSLGNEQTTFILPSATSGGWTPNLFAFQSVTNFAPGPALLTVIVNGIPSLARVVGGNGADLPNVTLTGSISGRATYHNGRGINAATLTLATPVLACLPFNGEPRIQARDSIGFAPDQRQTFTDDYLTNPQGEFNITQLPLGCSYTLTVSYKENGRTVGFVPTTRAYDIGRGSISLTGGGKIAPAVAPAAEPTPLPIPQSFCNPDCSNQRYSSNRIDGVQVALSGTVKSNGVPITALNGTLFVPYEDPGANLTCKDDVGNVINCTLTTKTIYGDLCTKLNPEFSGICSCTQTLRPDGTCPGTVLGRSIDVTSISFTNSGFVVAGIPYGSDALFTPSNQPITPASVPAQFTYSYPPNPDDPGRGTIFKELAGVPALLNFLNETITASPCGYTLTATPASPASFLAAGGSGSVAVTTAPGCNWLPASNQAWLTFTAGLNGISPVSYSVTANAGAPRNGLLTILPAAAQAIAIQQAGGVQAPAVTISEATGVTLTGATLNGAIIENGGDTTARFEYSTNNTFTPAASVTSVPLSPIAAGFGLKPVSAPVSNLLPNTMYYFRLIAANSGGSTIGTPAFQSFLTLPASIGGAVNYAISGVPVPGVNLSLSGGGTQATSGTGSYSFTGLGGGPYTVTPAKSNQINGLSGFDAALVARYSVGLTALSPDQILAGDADGDPNTPLGGLDAAYIARRAVGLTPVGVAGTWKFSPASRSYPTLASNLSGENFKAYLIGDVDGDWSSAALSDQPPAFARGDGWSSNLPFAELLAFRRSPFDGGLGIPQAISVSLPQLSGTPNTNLSVALTVGELTVASGVIAYDFTLNFDPTVARLLAQGTDGAGPTDKTGTLSSNFSVFANAQTPGLLRVTAFTDQDSPTGSGALLKLNFKVLGAPGAMTPLTLSQFKFNAGTPANDPPVNGRITVSSPAAIPTVTTAAASNITTTTATLNGSVNPNGAATQASFEYATNANFANSTTINANALPAGNVLQPVSANITGLTPGATYFFRVRAGNSAGPAIGSSLSFALVACVYSISPTSQSFPANGGINSVSVTVAAGCPWTAISNDSWITINSSSLGSGNGTVNYSVAANTGPQRMGTITAAGQTLTITQASGCTFSISPTSQTFTAAAGTGSVAVTTAAGCVWTATANDNWITINNGTPGSGNGTVGYSVAANTGPQRSGTLTVAGQTLTITQANGCFFSISPTTQNFSSAVATGSVAVTTTAGCVWAAVSNDNWITINSGAPGTGSGTVGYSVAANTGPQRSGTLTIAGQTFTVTQASGCTFSISPTSQSFTATGGTGSVAVSTAAGCAWMAVSNDNWITISSGTPGSGNGTVNYSVAVNTGPQRTGTITAAGQTLTITQTSGCTFSISPTSQTFTASAGTGSVAVSTTAGCAWTATSNVPWITINSGTPGNGNGTVNYSVAANTGPQRTGTMTVAGQTFTVTQDGGCTFAISPTSQSFTAAAATGTVAVTTATGCAWMAVSNDSWITINSGTPGSGNGTVGYSVAANTGGQRTGTMTVAGQTFTVTQASVPPPTISLSPASVNVAVGASQSITVSLSAAQSLDVTVMLTSSNSAVATVPASATIQANATSASFNVTGVAVGGPVTITATLPVILGGGSATASVQVNSAVIVRIGAGASGSPGGMVSVPIELVSAGGVNALGFSINFDTAVLGSPQAALGSDGTGAAFNVNPSQVAQGRLGVTLAMSSNQSFAAGTRQILTVTFTIAAGVTATGSPITFGSQPIAQEVADAAANTLLANFQAGAVTINQGIEADVSPRPNGNGAVTVTDWVQVGRFVAGLDQVNAGSEYQRADCAPRSTAGNGSLTISDWVQAGRYAAGLDPVIPAGGPTAPASAFSFAGADVRNELMKWIHWADARTLRLRTDGGKTGSGFSMAIELDALGEENAAGFSVNFDRARWRWQSADLAPGLESATLLINRTEIKEGRVGIALALPPGQRLPAGRHQLVMLHFSQLRDDAGVAAFGFSDSPVSRELIDVDAAALPVNFTRDDERPLVVASAADSAEQRLARESIAVVFGANLAPMAAQADGQPLPAQLAETQVILLDSQGVEHAAPLFSVSPEQIVFQVPAEVALGPITIAVRNQAGQLSSTVTEAVAAAPAIFSNESAGQGWPAAALVVVSADGRLSYEPVLRFDSTLKRLAPAPIQFGAGDEQLILVLFGTGIRHHAGTLSAQAGSRELPVLFAGPQGEMAGLDQINLALPRALAGSGEVELRLTVNGQPIRSLRLSVR